MPTSLTRRAVASLSVAATGIVLALATAALPLASAATVAPGAKTFYPGQLASTTDVPNPLRGQYRWMGAPSDPAGWAAPDVYYRDQVYWGRIERSAGVYNFSYIDTGLAAAAASNAKFGFRVMAYCPGCWMESRPEKDTWPAVTPAFVPKQSGTSTPDWNNPTFLSRWESLMAELGRRYANDPRLGYVDVGGYGKYGEWWVDANTPKITDANALRMVKAVTSAFPNKHVLLPTMPSVRLIMAAVNANPNLGIRNDSLGCSVGTMVPTTEGYNLGLQNVWKTRPFMSEWCSTGDAVKGRDFVKAYHVSTVSSGNLNATHRYSAMNATQQAAYRQANLLAGPRLAISKLSLSTLKAGATATVTITFKNTGSSPYYDPTRVQLRLTNSSGAIVAKIPLGINMMKQLPGSVTSTRYVTVPRLPAGTYTASVGVYDPSGYLAPMRLANNGRRSDGSYWLGTVGLAKG